MLFQCRASVNTPARHWNNIVPAPLVRSDDPANTGRWPNAGLLLAHRLRYWANISPALRHHHVFSVLTQQINSTHHPLVSWHGNCLQITYMPDYYDGVIHLANNSNCPLPSKKLLLYAWLLWRLFYICRVRQTTVTVHSAVNSYCSPLIITELPRHSDIYHCQFIHKGLQPILVFLQ